jgi:pimeloyl-ACP methyl ester carboxylesterase
MALRMQFGRTSISATLMALCAAATLVACSSSKTTSTTTTVAPTTTSATAPGAVATGVVAAPVLVAHTADGSVGYREVGSGTPLLLITGLGATMDDWDPIFVNRLALHHEVVMLDNAGVGMTAALPAPLTISAMADQTSAFITTLGLGDPDVLGWSMGGMIAQALAVRHPAQVNRLVLAATQPGNAKSLPVPAAAAAAVLSPNILIKLAVLFPADQGAAERAYVAGVLRYPARYAAPTTVEASQTTAIEQWLTGSDPSGPLVTTIRAPTLVADGSVDQLDPMANDQMLATIIPGAQIVLYPDAGHAFLFQDEATFVPRVEQLLG